MSASVHASAVLAGARAVLIRGPSGAGKSRLALELIEAAGMTALPFARLVGDDRVYLQAVGGRLLVRPADALAGLIEVRGLGIVRLAHEPCAVVGLVVDLAADGERLPQDRERQTTVEGVALPRLAVAAGQAPLPGVLALLTSSRQGPPHGDAGALGNQSRNEAPQTPARRGQLQISNHSAPRLAHSSRRPPRRPNRERA